MTTNGKSQPINLGEQIAGMRKLLDKARANQFVGAGDVALYEVYQALDRLLAIDAKTPLRFTVESLDVEDPQLGEVTARQTRLVGDWWVNTPEKMPLSPGNVGVADRAWKEGQW